MTWNTADLKDEESGQSTCNQRLRRSCVANSLMRERTNCFLLNKDNPKTPSRAVDGFALVQESRTLTTMKVHAVLADTAITSFGTCGSYQTLATITSLKTSAPSQAYTSNPHTSMVETSIEDGRKKASPGFVTQSRLQNTTDMDVLQ